ncbi:MAG: DNA translocase FtsK 4TM domain-containing protein, partial [Coriobacteriales bacterium]|nr:DNA translocase FtsK 4TM domain-containing protein [Coriobacteriales bacterium]
MSAQKAKGSSSKKQSAASGAGAAKKRGSRQESKHAAKQTQTSSKRAGAKDAADNRAPLLDKGLKRELVGLLIAILAIVLLIAVVAPGSAPLSRGISDLFHLVIGLGAYVFPFLMLAWAASFFIEKGVATTATRLGIGLVVIFVSVLSILGVSTSGAAQQPDLVFETSALMVHGGYVGGGIAWALLKLVGQPIAFVILIGLILVGAVLIGFSITGLVTRLRELLASRRKTNDEVLLPGAYDLEGDVADSRPARAARGKLVAATAHLSEGLEPTRALEGDFSKGAQGRIPLDELDELGDLGSTRRSLASADAADDVDGDRADSTVLLGATGATGAAGATTKKAAATTGAATSTTPFELPSLKLLKVSRGKTSTRAGESELRRTAAELQATIEEFGVDAQVEGWVAGPTVTLFKLSLGEGVRLSKINSLADDIALALAAPAVRIFSPIPGTTLVGIEVPNANRSMVLLGDVLPDAPPGALQLAIGKDVEGDSIVANLEKMPHLLIGGTTGSGKSVAINSMIVSLL